MMQCIISRIVREDCFQPAYARSVQRCSQMNLPKRLVYLKLILIIGLISVYDTALIVIYGDSIYSLEKNPVGNWLMTQGGVPLFATMKAILTICVVSCCILLVKTKYRVTIFGVLLFQVLLFLWLTFGGHSPFDGPNPLLDVIQFYLYGISE
jgi:hypothetical protein